MRIPPGSPAPRIILPALDGGAFDSSSLAGRPWMLSFLRFASCPFCNLRMHELVTRAGELPETFAIVAVFDSPLDNLRRHASRHQAPFPVLADAANEYYRRYGIEHSLTGVLKGVVMRMPQLLRAMFLKGYLPLAIKGRLTTMPADFLIDSAGVIRSTYYGKDEGDHMPFEQIREFAHGASARP